MSDSQIPWQKIKAEYILGTKLKDLAAKYNVNFETLRSRYNREKWSKLRTKKKQLVNQQIVDKTAQKEATDALDVITTLDSAIVDLKKEIDSGGIAANSLEGCYRELKGLLRLKAEIEGKIIQKADVKGDLKVSIAEAHKDFLDRIASRQSSDNS